MTLYDTKKILRFPERIAEWMRRGRTSWPVGFDLHLTNACPHNCPHCNSISVGRSDQMATEDVKRVIRGFAYMGTKAVHFCGGEPLAHPDGIELIRYAHDMRLSVGLITNLYRLTEDDSRTLARCCSWVRVSLDAANSETYRRRHGVGASEWTEVAGNIERLCRLPGRDAKVGIGFLTDETVAKEIGPATGVAENLGADYIQFRPLNDDYYDARVLIEHARHSHGIKVIGADHKYEAGVRTYERCAGCHFWTLVTADLDMRVCCETKSDEAVIGNLGKFTVAGLWAQAAAVINKLDLKDCPSGCRMSANNALLDSIARPIEQEEHI